MENKEKTYADGFCDGIGFALNRLIGYCPPRSLTQEESEKIWQKIQARIKKKGRKKG